jgi:arabinogalactan endo-1,4-beta-galactosidase
MPTPLAALAFALGLLPGVTLAAPSPMPEIRGSDVSSLPRAEALGARFLRPDGEPADPLEILRDHGVNTLRLRVWVDSPDGYHNAARILPLAKRARALGFRLIIDFHYSDTWADPAHQIKPAAWEKLPFDELVAAVHAHTSALCRALATQGTPADFVQIGNEINDGLLWPEGRVSTRGDDFAPLARLLQAGVRAAREAHPDTRIALQLGTAVDEKLVRWWFDGVRAAGVDWDLTALSYYPHLHGAPERLAPVLAAIAERYSRPVLIMETAHPFTLENADRQRNMLSRPAQLLSGYEATPAGQAAFLRAVFDVVRRIPDSLGAGVVYWEPTWIATEGNGWNNRDPRSGNNWENQALFDFSGRALPALSAFAEP